MAKAKKTKPKEHLHRWRAILIKGTPAKYLGHVYANSEADAVKEAAREFNVADALQDRIAVTKDEFKTS
jgi:hypothetical protein